jgi:hypothetical protein
MPYSLTRHVSLCLWLAVAVVLLGNPPTASAQLSRFSPATGNSQFLDFRGTGGQTWQTDIAYDPVNDVYLVAGGFGEINAQFVDAMASPISPVLVIQKDTWVSANCPTVTFSRDLNGGKGAFLVTWHQTLGGWDTRNEVYGRVVSYTDGVVGSPIRISDVAQGSSYQQIYAPAAYSVTSQKFLVVWTTTDWKIEGRFVDKDATPQGSVMLIDDDGGNMWPGVTWNESTNEFGISNCGWGNSGAYARFRRMSASGALSDRTTFGYGGGTFTSDIAYNNVTTDYVMVWSAGASGMQAAAFNSAGTMLGYGLASAELTANMDNIGFAFNPVSQTFLVVGHYDYDDLGVELNETGAPISAGTRVTAGGTTGAYYPRTTASAIAPHFAVVTSLNQKVPAVQIMATSSAPSGPTLTANPASPVPAGTPITFTATTSKTEPQEYKFWRFDGTTWTIVQDYTTSNTYTWDNPTIGTYRWQVWVRAAGTNPPAGYDQFAETSMVVTPPPVTSVTVTPSAATVLPGTSITWTAVAAGGPCTVEYQFFMKDLGAGTPYTQVQPYGTGNTWTFSAPAVGAYLVQVWARCQGSPAQYEAWANSVPVMVGVAAVVVTPSTTTATTGTSVTWTAVPVGGVPPVQYRFCIKNLDSGGWTEAQAYSASPTFTIPQIGNGHWVVEVWARSAGSTSPYESYADAATVTAAPAPVVVTSVTSDFTNASDGTAITWTASATGGTPPLQYRFYRRDGSGVWTIVQDYGATNKYTWPSAVPGTYIVEVWVRSYGSSSPYEAYGDSAQVVVTSLPAVTSVSVTPSTTSAYPGTSVTWTATSAGGVAPIQYRFCITNLDVGGWTEVLPWSTTAVWTMTNAVAGRYVVEVWARSNGSTRTYDTYADAPVVTVGIPPVSITSLTPSVTSAMAGDSVTWTVVATGGTPPLQYRFYRYDSATGWTMVRDYGTANTYTWNGVAIGTYTVEVWARSAGSTRLFEAYQDAVPVVIIPRPPVSGVTVAPSVTSAPMGSPVAWTASAAGGVTPYEYRFYLRNDATGAWTSVQGYGTSPAWSTSALAPGTYLMQVWARSGGSTAAWEAWNNAEEVTILQPPAPVIDSFTASSTSVSVGTPVTLTATTSGGVAPVVYTFFVRDDSTMTWTQIQRGASNTCSFTPTHAGSYLTEVWVSSAGATVAYQAFADLFVVAQ